MMMINALVNVPSRGQDVGCCTGYVDGLAANSYAEVLDQWLDDGVVETKWRPLRLLRVPPPTPLLLLPLKVTLELHLLVPRSLPFSLASAGSMSPTHGMS